ncbi:DUF3524 domain-containing protein [candidate division GN15 bacterium]|nr:DUF3524 domain-containing protein [candidate division GN15 bacterium]
MKILALEPFYGGSHRAFLDGWRDHSSHAWTILGLPDRHWKWRMRHAAVTLAETVKKRVANGETWDLLFCSDMLNLAEFVGLAPETVRALPRLIYFHENQLTYPDRVGDERDLQLAFTNYSSMLAADRVWFNSAFHRDQFFAALHDWLARMPDFEQRAMIAQVRAKSTVAYPGIREIAAGPPDYHGPARLLWSARWEHDKNPDDFLQALRVLADRGVEFRLNVIGQAYREVPAAFDVLRSEFGERILRWGHQPSRQAYEQALVESDLVVSTAVHEFFGIAVLEAAQAGVIPIVPNRLSYPEVIGAEPFLYEGSVDGLADRLEARIASINAGDDLSEERTLARQIASQYLWQSVTPTMDTWLNELVAG